MRIGIKQEPKQQHQVEKASGGSSFPLPIASGQSYRAPFIQQVQRARHTQRLERYQQMVELQRQGMTTAQIAARIGLSSRTIRRWFVQEHLPEVRQRQRRPSLIDPYETYVITRWQLGCHNGLQIWREVAARGYSGSPKALYSYLTRFRLSVVPSAKQSSTPSSRKRGKIVSSSGPSDPFLTRRAVRLLLRHPTKLTPLEQKSLQMLRQFHPQIEALYQLIQGFMSMLYQHQAESLDTWLAAMRGCGIAELERFGRGIEQDKAAVVAGLTLPLVIDLRSEQVLPPIMSSTTIRCLRTRSTSGSQSSKLVDSRRVRAVSFHMLARHVRPKKRTSTTNEAALQALILEAVGLNKSKANEPSFYESHHL